MREEEFRRRLQNALGEPPPLAPPTLGAPTRRAAAARVHPRAMGLLAIGVAVLLVVVLVGSRVALQPRGYVSPVLAPRADSTPCHLPVDAVTTASNPGSDVVINTSLGFVNIPTGTFSVDPHAKVSDLPGGSIYRPSTYSSALHRWLPVDSRAVSPDSRSYAYTTGSELHVVDAAARKDRKVWTHSPNIDLITWTAAGILVSTVPPQGGVMLLWRVDPTSGAATQASMSDDPTFFRGTGYSQTQGTSYLGGDSSGRSVFRLGGRDQGTSYYIVLVDSGRTSTIYAGRQGDATDFDPVGVSFDGNGLWFGNYDGSRVWWWKESAGLQSFRVSGTPAAPSGYQFTNFTLLPAGPCLAGTFEGTPATPLAAAPQPSPSPTPPVIDWGPLLAKPVTMPSLPAGSSCPVTPMVSINGQTKGPKPGVPNYGYGNSPVYLSGQINWYSAGSQGLLVLTDPTYSGPVLVRSNRLDGSGTMTISSSAGSWLDQLAVGAVGIPQTSSPPYWSVWFGVVTMSAPGCYGIQFDGTTFSEYVVIEVKQGPPPAG